MNRLTPSLIVVGALAAGVCWVIPESPTGSDHDRNNANSMGNLTEPGAHDPRPASPGASALRPDEVSETFTQRLHIGAASERDHALNPVLPRLLAHDSTPATHLAPGPAAGTVRDDLLAQAARQWAETDLHACLAWITSLTSAADRSLAAAAVIDHVAQDDPAGALELAPLLQSGTRDGSAERRAQLWAEDSPASAAAWIVTQPAGDYRDRLLTRIAHVRARQEPAEAASLVLTHMRAGEARDDALLTVVRQWTLRDPIGAEAWVSRFPPGPLLLRARSTIETARKQSAL